MQNQPIDAAPWSHHDELTKGIGKRVTIHTASETFEGVIKAADPISVMVSAKKFSTGGTADIVIFKSAIRYFEVKA